MISGETIRFIRKRRNLTQQELSELIGISRTTINDWENNKKRISKASESKLKVGCVYRV